MRWDELSLSLSQCKKKSELIRTLVQPADRGKIQNPLESDFESVDSENFQTGSNRFKRVQTVNIFLALIILCLTKLVNYPNPTTNRNSCKILQSTTVHRYKGHEFISALPRFINSSDYIICQLFGIIILLTPLSLPHINNREHEITR